jgi:hypothetical protein
VGGVGRVGRERENGRRSDALRGRGEIIIYLLTPDS